MGYPFKRVAACLNALRAEITKRWPGRDQSSDGALGDQRHQALKSDHNPNKDGIVLARDFDKDGIDVEWVVEHLRLLGALGDERLVPEGYLIWDHHITGAGSVQSKRWNTWRPYHGTNPHDHHFHLSCTHTAGAHGYDSLASWGIDGSHALIPTDASTFDIGSSGHAVKFLQQALNWLAPYRIPDSGRGRGGHISEDGEFGKQTKTAAKEFQRFCNRFLIYTGKLTPATQVREDGVVDPKTLQYIADWTKVVFGTK